MTTTELLTHLRKLNITLSADNGQLIFNGPKGALTVQLRDELRERKAEILEFLHNAAVTCAAPPESSLRCVSRDKDLPLSFAQQRLWFLDQLEPGSAVYNVPGSLRIKGPLDVHVLKQSLNEIVRRHEALRTTFSIAEGEPVQVIASSLSFFLPALDISHFSESEREEETLRLATEEAKKPFDLAHGPLFRPTLIRLGEDDHVFLLTLHHIVSDGWSMGVLHHELSVLYQAFSNAETSPLADLPIQYADFAAWQREWLQGEVLESQLSYWKKQLEGAPVVLNLPTDRPRPAVQSFRGARRAVELSTELTEGLKTLSRKEGATLYMTLLAAFQTLLHRYTGQDDIVIGSPIANRNRIEIEGLIGFFVNTLVLRTDYSGNPTFRNLLHRVRETALEAYAHQDLPFEKLVEELRPDRDLSRSPLFQTMFVFQNAPARELSFKGLTVSPLRVAGETAKFDLTLSVNEAASGLRSVLHYSTDLFDEATITRMLSHFETLLEGIVSHPEQRISDLPILTEAEKHQLLVEWNDTKTDYPKDKCIHELFETQVAKTPDAVALVFEDQQLTYRELNNRANQLAHHLRRRGVAPETLVATCMERSLEMVIGLLGVLKAGGAYVPLDPSYPKERLGFMLEDTHAGIVLTDMVSLNSLPLTGARVICLDRDWEEIAKEPQVNPGSRSAADSLAYVIYTSGSTGVPKGVEVRHRGVLRLLFGVDYVQLDRAQTFLHLTPISFDAATFEVWGALLHGCKCVLFPGKVPSPQELGEVLKNHRVNTLWLTAALFNTVINEEPQALSEVKQLLIGGEALSVPHVRKGLAQLPNTEIINGYGPTESTTFTCCYRIPRQLDDNLSSIPIGRPIGNTQVFILDPNLNPVPIGVAGEVHIGGDGLARGYLNRLELTKQTFIANPFSADATSRLYKTGDLARYLPDGNIEFLGRIDTQVKIRGYRIELGEIEAVLSQHPAIREGVVLAREDSPGDRRLVAYVVTAPGSAPSTNELRSYLQQKVPEYMVPSVFMFLAALPLTPNGKLHRKALPEPDRTRPELDETFFAPRTPVEQLLAKIWADVLKLDKVGIKDNFFDLGGHSLLATQAVSRICQTLQVELPLRALFESPTIAELAERIEEIHRKDQRLSGRSIVPISRDKPLPLSFSQQRLWFLDQYEPNSSVYNIPSALRLKGELNNRVLEQSLRAIVRRHESLRTRFSLVEGEPVQVISTSMNLSLSVVDLTNRSESEREKEAERLAREEALRPFDLNRGPLFRVTLIQLGRQDYVLLLTMHHIVSDGWSLGVLHRELSVFYGAMIQGKPPPLADLPIQYADFAVWQREWLQGEVLQRQLSYWKKQLEGIPAVLNLPTDRSRPAVQSFRGKRQSIDLSKELTAGLKALSRKQGVTLFMTLLAAFQTLLYRYTGQEDIVIGSPIANRTRTEVEGLIGFFVNTLVLRANFAGDPTFTELLARVKETALGAYAHQDLPFEKLVEVLEPQRSVTVSPLFQVMFVLQNTPSTALKLQDLELNPVIMTGETAKFDLTLSMRETPIGLKGSLQYSVDLFDESTIVRMVGHWQTMLKGIVANPDAKIGNMPILTDAEKCQLLVEQNNTQWNCPKDKCIHELFEEQADKSPDAVAAIFEHDRITYRELNARANQLAHYLRKQGVGPNVCVGVCVERSLEMLVGMLGVLKAGGAYVPLDPDYPNERLSFVLEDVDAKILITQQRCRARLVECPATAVYLDSDCCEIGRESADNLRTAVTGENLAYVMYTSGSTGKPKGVAIRHESIVRLVVKPNYVTLCPEDTVAQASNIAFDAATFEIWGALINGARLAIIPKEKVLSSGDLSRTLLFYRVTCMFVTTALFNRISHEKPTAFGGLRYLLFGGEICDPDRVKAVLQSAPPEHLVHVYGPTETTTFATFYEVARVNSDRAVPIGRPINATELILLDSRGQLVPQGIVGEIHIAGAGVASGYVNRPQETDMRFVPHPLRPQSGERVYRTGDLARWLADGNLEFVGRIDDQLKIRGLRIEPAEVSAVLNTHPAVKISHVVARRQVSGDVGLTAYIVPMDSAAPPKRSDFRRFLLERLPTYMVPVSFISIEEIPLTVNGKVDARALPEPGWQDTKAENDYVAPRDETETAMCRIWSEVLGLDRIGIDDNFFAVGGHSLLAAKLFTRLDEEFGRSFPLGLLFTAPTIRLLAEHYQTSTHANDRSVVIPLRKTGTLAPIYAVPGVFGNVVGFGDLTAELGPDQPFYGLQSIGLDGADVPLDSIESMANLYRSEIRKVQAHGPYALIGGCFGATVAYELARQFLESGEDVAFLGLLDPTHREGRGANGKQRYVPRLVKRAMAVASLLSDRFRLYHEEMRGLDIRDRLKYGALKLRSFSGSLRKTNRLKGVERELHQIEVYRANVRALDRYHRKPLHGPLGALEIFETARLKNSGYQEKLEWSVFWTGGNVVRHVMPGKDSGDMVSGRNARVLARLLSERLQEAFGHSSEESDARN